MKKNNLYDELGVNKNATQEEIKKAFRDQAKENHTDRGGDNDKMVAINKAYSVLKDPHRRKYYDETGEQEETPFDQKFFALVQDIFVKIASEEKFIETVDLIDKFKGYVSMVLQQQNEQKKDLISKIDKLKKVLTRLTVKNGKNNHISGILEHNITALKETLHRLENDIKFIEDCLEVISHYNYKIDRSQQQEEDEWQKHVNIHSARKSRASYFDKDWPFK